MYNEKEVTSHPQPRSPWSPEVTAVTVSLWLPWNSPGTQLASLVDVLLCAGQSTPPRGAATAVSAEGPVSEQHTDKSLPSFNGCTCF